MNPGPDSRAAAEERAKELAALSGQAKSRVRAIRDSAERLKERLERQQAERYDRDLEAARQEVLTSPPSAGEGPRPPAHEIEEQARKKLETKNRAERDAIERKAERDIDDVLALERIVKGVVRDHEAGRDVATEQGLDEKLSDAERAEHFHREWPEEFFVSRDDMEQERPHNVEKRDLEDRGRDREPER